MLLVSKNETSSNQVFGDWYRGVLNIERKKKKKRGEKKKRFSLLCLEKQRGNWETEGEMYL